MLSQNLVDQFIKMQTPFYYYDMALLQKTVDVAKTEAAKYNYHLHYAIKANLNQPILQLMAKNGFGADCVSGREVQTAVDAGFTPDSIVFAGVGKGDDEINTALDLDIFCFNCESSMEIEVINDLAKAKGKTAKIALRINPEVNANTHKYITTGLAENKFGINMWELDAVLDLLDKCDNIELIGLHFHIGSQITDLNSFKNLASKINKIQEWFISRQHVVKVINAGGGLGVDYYNPDGQIPDFAEYFRIFNEFLELRPGQEVHFELGRSLVTQCGSLISKALFIKNGVKKNFAILDAGMTQLIRPMLYNAHHEIENLTAKNNDLVKYDVVGPICESTDCFAKDLELPTTSRGDLFEIKSAGGYGEVMQSDYNQKTLYAPVYSDNM